MPSGVELPLFNHGAYYVFGVLFFGLPTLVFAALTGFAYAAWRDERAALAALGGTVAGAVLAWVVPADWAWLALPAAGFLLGFHGYLVTSDRASGVPSPTSSGSGSVAIVAGPTVLSSLVFVYFLYAGHPGGPVPLLSAEGMHRLGEALVVGGAQLATGCFALYRTRLGGLLARGPEAAGAVGADARRE